MSEAAIIDGLGAIHPGWQSAINTLTMFKNLSDQIIPHSMLAEATNEMERFSGLPSEAALIIGEIKTLTLTAITKYHWSTELIYEWCGTASQHLNMYINLFNEKSFTRMFQNLFNQYDEEKAKTQKDILIKVLSEGMEKMNAALDTLLKGSESFDKAAGKLSELQTQLNQSSEEQWGNCVKKFLESQSMMVVVAGALNTAGLGASAVIFYISRQVSAAPMFLVDMVSLNHQFTALKEGVENRKNIIDMVRKKFTDEMRSINKLKIQTDATNFILPRKSMRDEVIPAIKKLIYECDEYCKRHEVKN